MEGIRLFGKSDKFVLRFVCTANKRNTQGNKKLSSLSLIFPKASRHGFSIFSESDEILMVSSPKALMANSMYNCEEKTSGHVIDDLDIMKSHGISSSFLFHVHEAQRKNKLRHVSFIDKRMKIILLQDVKKLGKEGKSKMFPMATREIFLLP
jgi:hypothetical protein